MSAFPVFTNLSTTVQASYPAPAANRWAHSPFQWIAQAHSGRKGAIGKRLVRGWAEGEGLLVLGKSSRGHDFRVNGHRVVVKLSLIWDDGRFVFQQIKDQPYDMAALLALESRRARLWILPKNVLWRHAAPQHTGRGGQDTKWLHFPATRPPAWLTSGYGRGTLPRARRALK